MADRLCIILQQRRVEHEGKLCKERFRMTDIEEDTFTATMLTAEDEDTQKTQVYLQYDFSKRNHQSALPVFNARKEVSSIVSLVILCLHCV